MRFVLNYDVAFLLH